MADEQARLQTEYSDPAKRMRAYISKEELRSFQSRSSARLLFDGIAIWAVILGAIALWSSLEHWIVWVTAFLLIAARQHALNCMVHEASHLGLSQSQRLNDLLSDLFFAAPQGITTDGYRGKHMRHHTHLGHPSTDTERKYRYQISGRSFLKRTAKILCGSAAFEAAREYGTELEQRNPKRRARSIMMIMLIQAGLFFYCTWVEAPWAYFHLWILPLLTFFPYFAALSVIAEHQSEEYAASRVEDYEKSLEPGFTRSVHGNWIERFFLAPGNFCFHLEHHAFPSVRYDKLPSLNRLLTERGFFRDCPQTHGASFTSALSRLIFSQRASNEKQ